MSDIDEKPWEQISDARVHRCRPPAGELGAVHECSCGVDYRYVDSAFGGQWLPASDVVASGSRSHRRVNANF